MTSCDKRLEELLNRAGQTISDLPDAYSYDEMIKAEETLTAYLAKLYPDNPIRNEPENFLWFILHLTDIIDRMEWALDKTLREKAYLRAKCCYQCGALDGVLNHYDGMYIHQTCDECDIEHVPDDWEEDI